MIRVAFFDTKPYDKLSFTYHTDLNNFDVTYFDTKLNINTVKLAKGYDAVCVFVNDIVDKDVIDKLYSYNVKVIALRCAGFNNVDVKAAYRKIHVVRVPAYSPYAVAEHTMALLLTSIRRIHKSYIRTRDYNFSLIGLTGFDLHDKTIGIIGTGNIGQVLIDICKGFKMNILTYDPFPKIIEGVKNTTFDELIEKSDIISLHCPLTNDNKHMINEKTIAKMKKGVIIINTSRGALIDSEALLRGIKERHIGAACIDVYEEESDIFFEDNSGHILDDDTLARLISMPNVIVTSHQAFLTNEALDSIAKTTMENITEIIKNAKCKNEVCYRCENFSTCVNKRIEKCF